MEKIPTNMVADMNANMAFALIERWGMVAATPDGEDSAGRQKFRLQTSDELVARAFTVATDAVRYALSLGYMRALPDDAPL